MHLARNPKINEVMLMEDRLKQLNQVFQDVFDDDDIQIDRQTTAKDVEGWDSLMHVTLVVNVEKAFKMKFSSSDVAALQNVGELLDLINARSPAN
jgi:acyl carrier protein